EQGMERPAAGGPLPRRPGGLARAPQVRLRRDPRPPRGRPRAAPRKSRELAPGFEGLRPSGSPARCPRSRGSLRVRAIRRGLRLLSKPEGAPPLRPLKLPERARPPQLSMKLLSCFEREGWRSLRSALASI